MQFDGESPRLILVSVNSLTASLCLDRSPGATERLQSQQHDRGVPSMSTPTSPNDDGLIAKLPPESVPPGVDRRSFFMRSGVIGAAAVMTGTTWTPEARAAQAAKEASGPKLGSKPLSPELAVVKKSKGPVMKIGRASCRERV